MRLIEKWKSEILKAKESFLEKKLERELAQLHAHYEGKLELEEEKLKLAQVVLEDKRKEYEKVSADYDAKLSQLRDALLEAEASFKASLEELALSRMKDLEKRDSLLTDKYQEYLKRESDSYSAKLSQMIESNEKALSDIEFELNEKLKLRVSEIEKIHTRILDEKIASNNKVLYVEECRTNSLLRELKQKQEDCSFELRRQQQREEDLKKTNSELEKQIRMLEAKARPDSVWVEAFTAGYTKGFDTLAPLLSKTNEELPGKIRDFAMDESLKSLKPLLDQKLDEVGKSHLKGIADLLAKKKEFESKLSSVSTDGEKVKYTAYIQALEWALDGNNIRKREPVSR